MQWVKFPKTFKNNELSQIGRSGEANYVQIGYIEIISPNPSGLA